MQWVAEVTRNYGGSLTLRVQDRNGNSSYKSLRDLPKDFGLSGLKPYTQHFDFTKLRRGSTCEYLHHLKLSHLSAEGQPVYEIEGDLGTIVIPAQLLIFSTFGTWTALRRVLLSPMGVDSLKVAIGNRGKINLPHAHYRRLDESQLRHEELDRRLTWIHGYPSATSAWGSVFRRGIEGKFDMSLPFATACLSFGGEPSGEKFLVTRLQISEIKPYEQPHKFAFALPTYPRALPSKEVTKYQQPKSHDPRIQVSKHEFEMTDSQWALVEPLVNKLPLRIGKAKLLRIYSRKELVEAILKKLGVPLAWSELSEDGKFSMSARALLRKLKMIDVWDEIVQVLESHMDAVHSRATIEVESQYQKLI